MLTDTGPLIALLDENDAHHEPCAAAIRNMPNEPLLTTWLCFTEAIYLLGEAGGYRFQTRLWHLRRNGTLSLLDLTKVEVDHMDVLMERYQNVPMDAADASVVAVADMRNLRRLFTIDKDFYIYRLTDGSVLDIVPG